MTTKKRAKKKSTKPTKPVKSPARSSKPIVQSKKPVATNNNAEAGRRHREQVNIRARAQTDSAKDIGEIPPVANPSRRESCLADLALFLQTYFPGTFTLPFCADHRVSIAKTQKSIDDGGLFAMAEPRGSGKTARVEGSAIYAALKGKRKFIVLIGATADAATELLDSIKMELETNELLLADFPEAVFPIQELEGEPRRCKGQTYHGERTHSQWSQDVIVFPTIPGSASASVIMRVVGITGRVRGMKFKRPDGTAVRPDYLLIDDFQTDSSANSESQCRTRERTLSGAILGLAGPGKRIAGVMPCTVIRGGDVADRMLSPKLHPEWNGSRFKLMYAFPTNEELWGRYKEILIAYNPTVAGDKERAAAAASDFYLEHFEEMNAGARVAWEHRFEPGEHSAIQNAMNLKIRDERAFFAEYQNEPMPEDRGDFEELTADAIASKVNRVPRFQVPTKANRITLGIDVQGKLLYYLVAAWENNFTGYILDYGTWPEQKGRSYFTLSDAKRTLASETKIDGLEGQIYSGLDLMTKRLISHEWLYASGAGARIERALADSGWGDSTPVVFQFCRQSPFAANLTPSKGIGIGPTNKPIGERVKKDGERVGLEWYMPVARETRGVRSIQFDTNFWKSFIHSRLSTPMGSPGCLSIFGESPQAHQMLADHLTSEYRVRTEGRGRIVDVWLLHANRENHWLDCLVMAAVGASMQGVGLGDVHAATKTKGRQYMSLEERKAKARGGKPR